jgi:hypothetical protein
MVILAEVPATQPTAEESYTIAVNKRASDAVRALKLMDEAQATRVHEIIASQYRNLRKIDDAIDPQLKDAGKDKDKVATIQADRDAQRKQLHGEFLASLEKELTAEQIDVIKDQMTYNVLHVTYDAYCDMISRLTEEQKTYIMQQLTEARELAMDGGSSKEKHAIFGKYKGRINIYLSKAGYNMKEEEKARDERVRAQRRAATQPGN